MKKKHLYLLLALTIGFASCHKEEEEGIGTLQLVFKAQYDGVAAVLNTDPYDYFDGQQLKLSNLLTYISRPSLLQKTTRLQLDSILFVDFSQTNRTLDGAEDGIIYEYPLASGDYDGVYLGLGVAEDMNALLPTDYPTGHPLAQPGLYWSAWNSFIFSKTEGKMDTDGDGSFDLGFAYHIGSDMMFREATFTEGFRIKKDEVTTMVVTIDFKRVLGTEEDHIDIVQYPAFHNPQDPTLASLTALLSNNFKEAVSLQINQ